jgi:hypothetical protein
MTNIPLRNLMWASIASYMFLSPLWIAAVVLYCRVNRHNLHVLWYRKSRDLGATKGLSEGLLRSVTEPRLLSVSLCREHCQWNCLHGYAADLVNASVHLSIRRTEGLAPSVSPHQTIGSGSCSCRWSGLLALPTSLHVNSFCGVT